MTERSDAASGPPESSVTADTDKNGHAGRVVHRASLREPGSGTSAASGPPESSLTADTDKNGRRGGVVHRFLPSPDSGLGRFIRRVQPDEANFRSPAHHEKVTTRLGLWLGVAFLLCFLTGLLSHLIQHPPAWFGWPARPANLYRVTQGIHVISGVAAVPLLFAKLWSVYPKLFSRPVIRSLPHALERLSILVLSGAAFFELTTGIFNVAQNYPWAFYFPAAHYAVAWIAFGSVILHVAVKLPVIRRALATPVDPARRSFLRTGFLATGAAVVATAGVTVPLLRDVSPLSWRSDRGPQGLPVNRTANAARVTADPAWRLEIVTRTGITRLSRTQLADLPQRTADLPIACVEGWSQSATWTGVPIADLLALVGAPPGSEVRVTSLERRGAYRVSTLPGSHTRDPDTLLALRLNGETLALDHGFPARIIAPSRPGVLQTKWVHRLEVL
jgi:DMSO/TMAO reductase YedYZ molybdopterin-dependent catalytic subunit